MEQVTEFPLQLLAIVFFACVLLAAFLMFDRLVRLEYQSYRKNWEADGQPHGFFWVPPEVKRLRGWTVSFRSDFTSKRCSYVWLFSTPDWVRRDEKAKQLLTWLRILVAVWNMSILLSAFFVFSHLLN
jgi:hypothetical protein